MRYPSMPCGWQWTPLSIPRVSHALPLRPVGGHGRPTKAYHTLPHYALWVGMDAPKYLYGVLCSTPCGWPWTPQSISMAYHALPLYALWVSVDAQKYLYGVPCATPLRPVGGHGRPYLYGVPCATHLCPVGGNGPPPPPPTHPPPKFPAYYLKVLILL
jgi:hypothetical protein